MSTMDLGLGGTDFRGNDKDTESSYPPWVLNFVDIFSFS